MTEMDLNALTWGQRGQSPALRPMDLDYTLQGINDRIVRADRRLSDAHGMTGIGYADRTGAIGDVSTDLGTINSYVGKLPDDIAALLDDPLFEAFANGPTQAISKIRAEDIKTPNTLGVTCQQTYTSPDEYGSTTTVTFQPGAISFADLILPDDIGKTASPFFADIFAAAHLSYVGGGSDGLSLSDYVQALVHNGEFTHHGHHPVKDFISTVLDVTVVWAVIKAATGHDPITGEDLSGLERGVEAGMGLVNLVAMLLAIPTGGGSLGGAAWARGAATAVLKTLLVNAIATGASVITFNTAIDLGLPSWAATLIALGVGFTIGVVGAKYVILGPKGEPVGKPFDINPSDVSPDGVDFSIGAAPQAHPDWPILKDGSQFDPITGKLKPNVRYQTGAHNYIYTTDAQGRIDSFHADDLQFKTHSGRLPYQTNPPGKQAGDDAGHLAADLFGGSNKLDNIVAQLSQVNQKTYRGLEREWADALTAGKKVSVDVRITNDPITGRPTEFLVSWTIDGIGPQTTIILN